MDNTVIHDTNEDNRQGSHHCSLQHVNRKEMETNVNCIDDRHTWKTTERDGGLLGLVLAGRREDEPSPLVLPLIDLKDLASDDPISRNQLARQIGLAAEESGFFQVKNHGIPESLIENMMSHGKEFFQLPMEVKERAWYRNPKKNNYYQGYFGRFHHLQSRAYWLEVLGENEHPTSEVESLARKIWSGGNPSFCQIVREYNEALAQFGRNILELLAEHLGLESDFFSKHMAAGKSFQSNWRFNYYPACPRPDLALGVGPHQDPNALTILTQDEVGGFQLWKDNFWRDVKPIKDTFLVNIGDTLRTWTNGKLKSAIHRAIVHKASARLSIIYFLSPPEGTSIVPHSSLIDPRTHPLKDSDPIWSHTFRSRMLFKDEM